MPANKGESTSGLLKIFFLAHLVLSGWGMESSFSVPTGYLYYNLILMISLMWAISSDNMDSVAMAFLINLAAIGMDVFTLAYWPRGGPSREKIYFGIAIANAVLRGITGILLYRLFGDRDTEGLGLRGAFGDILGVFNRSSGGSGDGDRKGYERLDGEQGQQQGESSSQGPSSEPQRGGGNSRGAPNASEFSEYIIHA